MLTEPVEPAEFTETPAEPPEPSEEAPTARDPFNGIPGIEDITRLACDRIQQLRTDQGCPAGTGRTTTGWARKRADARESYAGDMRHRARLGGIFANERTNISMNVPGRFIRLMAAKYTSDLIGSRPFFATMPAKIKDKAIAKIAKQIEAKVQDAIWDSNLQPVLSESIRVSLTEGERAVKLTWLQDETEYPGPAEVAVDGAGVPIKTPRGDYIFRNDDVIRLVVAMQEDGTTTPVRTLALDEQPVEGEMVEIRLKKEPGYLFVTPPIWQTFTDLPQKLVNWSGLHAAGLFCEDFLYPVNVSSLRDPACDIMVHCYDTALDDVVAEYQNAGFADQWRTLQRTGALSQASQPQGGEQEASDSLRPILNIHETYFKVRLPGARKPSWLFIVIDYRSRLPIYAEYLGKLKMKRPPFVLLRGLESVPGRAYGMGVYEKFWDKHCTIDALFVRASSKNASDASIDFMHRGGIDEVSDQQQLQIGTALNGAKATYHIPANQPEFNKTNPPYFRVNLNEMNEGDFELMVRLIESGELEFGYLSAANENTKGDNTTATEVRNVERTGNILHESSEALISGDIEQILEIATDIILENSDLADCQYIEGSEELAGMNPDEIRRMSDIRILRSKQSAADQIEVNTAVKQLILEYAALPAKLKKAVRDQFVELGTSYRLQDSDDKFPEPTDEEIAAEAQASVQPQPPSVNVRLADIDVLAPSERQQFMQKYLGINAAPPEEVMAVAQQKQAFALEEQKIKLLGKPKEEAALAA